VFVNLLTEKPLTDAPSIEDQHRKMFSSKVLLDESCGKKVSEIYKPSDKYLIIVGNSHMLYSYGIPSCIRKACPEVE
jgi:uncharacterized iron-regulated protein